eukprot:1094423-Pleurochrysis_carterae.AAC.1
MKASGLFSRNSTRAGLSTFYSDAFCVIDLLPLGLLGFLCMMAAAVASTSLRPVMVDFHFCALMLER